MADEHSFSLTTFSPNGKLQQIEYALARVASGGTSLAVKGKQNQILKINNQKHNKQMISFSNTFNSSN